MKDEYRNPTIILSLMVAPIVITALYAPILVWPAVILDALIYKYII